MTAELLPTETSVAFPLRIRVCALSSKCSPVNIQILGLLENLKPRMYSLRAAESQSLRQDWARGLGRTQLIRKDSGLDSSQ